MTALRPWRTGISNPRCPGNDLRARCRGECPAWSPRASRRCIPTALAPHTLAASLMESIGAARHSRRPAGTPPRVGHPEALHRHSEEPDLQHRGHGDTGEDHHTGGSTTQSPTRHSGSNPGSQLNSYQRVSGRRRTTDRPSPMAALVVYHAVTAGYQAASPEPTSRGGTFRGTDTAPRGGTPRALRSPIVAKYVNAKRWQQRDRRGNAPAWGHFDSAARAQAPNDLRLPPRVRGFVRAAMPRA
jgi:hypothetical protein